MTLGERIKAARTAAGMTQEDVGRHFDVTRNAVSLWESNKNQPDAEKMPALAVLLGVATEWLWTERGPRYAGHGGTTKLVGYVGAGEEVYPFDDHAQGDGLEELPAIPGLEDCVAVKVRGDSMYPVYRPGDALYYRREFGVRPAALIGAECVVKVADGPTLIKVLQPGRRAGCFDLNSYNARPLLDQPLEWAAPVEFVKRAW